MNDLCIYHASCADGLSAAAVVKLKMDKSKIECEFMAAQYGDEAPDVTGRHVIIVDFSYPREVLERMHKQADSLLVIDHHKSAQANCVGLSYCIFDMKCSGAVLAWKVLCGGEPVPRFLQYIQDRDLWQWKLPDSKEFSAGLLLEEFSIEVWADMINDPSCINRLIKKGAVVHDYQEQQIKKQVKRAFMTTIAGYEVPTINCTHLISEIGNELCKGQPFAAMYFETEDKRIYSLRSDENGLDVSKIAESYEGGGGHKNAAGFSIPKSEFVPRKDFDIFVEGKLLKLASERK